VPLPCSLPGWRFAVLIAGFVMIVAGLLAHRSALSFGGLIIVLFTRLAGGG
jgi:hypothetical protein